MKFISEGVIKVKEIINVLIETILYLLVMVGVGYLLVDSLLK